MNDRMERAEPRSRRLAQTMQTVADTMQALADSQKHTDEKLAALTDIVRNWYERHGNGTSDPPSVVTRRSNSCPIKNLLALDANSQDTEF